MSKFIIKDLYDHHTNLSKFFYLNNKKLIFNKKEIKCGYVNDYKTSTLTHTILKQRNKIKLISQDNNILFYVASLYDSFGNFTLFTRVPSYNNIFFLGDGKIINSNPLNDDNLPKNIFEWTEEEIFYYELAYK